MPTFATRKPTSIANSIASLLGSSPRLSALDMMSIDEKAANVGHRNALAEKAMLEVQQMREAERARGDPQRAVEYGAMTSGLDVPVAEQLYRAIQGMVAPNGGVTADEEGNPLPPATYAKPEGVRPEQERAFRSSIAATMANILGTGKTNADQLAHAGARLNETAARNEATTLDSAAAQNRLVAPYRATNREPFSNVDARGLVTNQESGSVQTARPDLYTAALDAVRALSQQRESSAAASQARADVGIPAAASAATTRAGVAAARLPAQVAADTARATHLQERAGTEETRRDLNAARVRNLDARTTEVIPAQVERSRALADAATQAAEDRRGKRQSSTDLVDQAATRSTFAREKANNPQLKNTRLGNWVAGKGFEVVNPQGGVVGYVKNK